MLRFLRNETAGGLLLLAAAVVALIWVNLEPNSYLNLRDFKFGFAELHLDLTVGQWASDGLLAIFFFVAGMELKNEFLAGSLKDKKVAIVPIAAAIGGMIVPALIFCGFNFGGLAASGWGIPMATDIAFALAVLAVAGRQLPIELRAFLLTLAVVDDLGAIIVIAIFYTASINLIALAAAVAALAVFGYLQHKGVSGWYIYIPLALVAWATLHASGIHATVAGVAMGLLMNLKRIEPTMHIVHPISAGLAVPVFALLVSGVPIHGLSLDTLFTSPLGLGIILGLVVGKPLGVLGTSWLVTRFSKASLASRLSWWDIATVGVLAGVGFTVSLLINELAFKSNPMLAMFGTLIVLVASTISAVLAIIAIQFRNRAHA